MKEQVIDVLISPNGEDVQVSVNGVDGATCYDFSRAIEEALGRIESTKETEEYYRNPNYEIQRQNQR